MADRERSHADIVELLHHDHYTCEELAELLDMDLHYVQHEALTGNLKAILVDHHIASISREAVVEWLRVREVL